MELSISEMLVIFLVIIILFGPKKIPEIARGLGQGVRKMKSAMEDIKTEIMKDDNPISDIKREIDSVKKSIVEMNPMEEIKNEISMTTKKEETIDKESHLEDSHEGPVIRK